MKKIRYVLLYFILEHYYYNHILNNTLLLSIPPTTVQEYVMELERIRAKRQQERDKAVASGDLKTLQELAGGAGRGARSKSNLPAWMTAQMDVAATAAGGLGLGNTAATHFES